MRRPAFSYPYPPALLLLQLVNTKEEQLLQKRTQTHNMWKLTMKIEVLQENLNKALTTAARLVSSKPQLPVLSNILMSISKEGGVITSSNVESSIVIPFGVKVEEIGEVIVPARTLQELVASLSSDKITLETKEGSLLVTQSKFQAKISCFSGGDYPKMQSEDTVINWKLPSKVFLNAVGQTIFSSATDEARAVLNGVLFKLTDTAMFVSTDGFRLSQYKFNKDISPKDNIDQVVVSGKALSEIVHLLTDSDSEGVEIGLNPSQVLFKVGEVKFYSQTIAGNFPDFEKIIPSSFDRKIKLTADELQKAVKTAAIFARENANIVRFVINGTELKIRAQGGEIGENETEIDIENDNSDKEEFSVAFNFRYILDFLSSIGGEKEITIEMGTSTSPALFRPVKSENYLHIIMPVRIQG